VFKPGGGAASHVEIGVLSNGVLYSAYSATNGNFWVVGSTDIDWATAEVRMRDSNGETSMQSQASSNCNSCHVSGAALIAP